MKEILEILTENLTLNKAIRLKNSSKKMDSRFLREILLPYTIVMAFFMIVIFAALVIDMHYDPDVLDGKDMDEELGKIGALLIAVMIGMVFGLLIRQSDLESAVRRIVDPVINDAIDNLAGCEDENSSDNQTETPLESK